MPAQDTGFDDLHRRHRRRLREDVERVGAEAARRAASQVVQRAGCSRPSRRSHLRETLAPVCRRRADGYTSNNKDIDNRWQQIMSMLVAHPLHNLNVLLAEQIGKQGQLLPFHSLFYCRIKQLFFHPPCPNCGQGLSLCADDTLLHGSGLEGYSTSLRRFLYCRQCSSADSPGLFYVLQRREDDPHCVADMQQLVGSWARLAPGNASEQGFPCHDCPGFAACFASNGVAQDNISSFSFYPFHMLLLKAESGASINFRKLLALDEQFYDAVIPVDKVEEQRPTVTSISGKITDNILQEDARISASDKDTGLRDILANIAARWGRADKEKLVAHKSGTDVPLPVGTDRSFGNRSAGQTTKPTELLETVILGGFPKSASSATAQLGATIQGGLKVTGLESKGKRSSGGDLLETVILSPRAKHPPGTTPNPQIVPDSDFEASRTRPAREDRSVNLAETIIQRPIKKP